MQKAYKMQKTRVNAENMSPMTRFAPVSILLHLVFMVDSEFIEFPPGTRL